MTKSKTKFFEELNGIFWDVFDDEGITVTEATTAADNEDWDLLTHIVLLSSVEEEFNMKDIQGLKDVGVM